MALSILLHRADLSMVPLLFFILSAFAKKQEIKGTLRSLFREPLLGVTVTVKRNNRSEKTKNDGILIISLKSKGSNETAFLSHSGYATCSLFKIRNDD